MHRKILSRTAQRRLAGPSVGLPTLVGLALVGWTPIGCSADDANPQIGSVTAALTAEQCDYFQEGGKVQICHKTASTRKPYTILKISSEACVTSHSAHDGDYIAINDPTCNGQGCFPAGAPYDGTVECCDDLEPDATGHCAPVVSDVCAHASVGQVLSLQGVSLTVPAGAPDLSLCATEQVAPTHAANGATITARSPVFEFGPSGTTFSPGLPVSFEVGSEPDLSVFWAYDGVNYEELDATRVDDILTVSTNHFSPVVISGNPCAAPKVVGDICGVAPAFPCAAEPTCQVQGIKLKCIAQLKAAGTECNAATGGCDIAETCSGTSTSCPADAIASAGTVCRAAGGVCDLAESCDGAGKACPTDAKLTSSCRAAAGTCDLAESCDGSSNDCPTDAKSTAVCRPSTGDCDVTESCDGVDSSCPGDGFDVGAVCDAATPNGCDLDAICGATAACPPVTLKPANTACDDGNGLTNNDVCSASGVCAGVVCVPTTCAAQGKTCGTIPNGCGGTLTCGAACPACGQPLTNVSNIAAGDYGTCAVRTDGGAWCWGNNPLGVLGDGTTTRHSLPVPVVGPSGSGTLSGVSALDVDLHACALAGDGTVWCWGRNDRGQLGNGTFIDSSIPVQVAGVGTSLTPWVPTSWTPAVPGAVLTDVIQVEVGDLHTCALRSDGTAWCWGMGQYGQMGIQNDQTRPYPSIPAQITGTGVTLTGLTEITAGNYHNCARRNDGAVYCWGENRNGEIGHNINAMGWRAYRVVGPGGVGFFADAARVTAGRGVSCASKTDGTVYCWGGGSFGQLGNGDILTQKTPAQVVGPGGVGFLTGVANLEMGTSFSACALKADKTVWCWGFNQYGNLGDGTNVNYTTSPVQVRGPDGIGFITDATSLSVGGSHACVIRDDLTAWCWGSNAAGELGICAAIPSSPWPVRVTLQ